MKMVGIDFETYSAVSLKTHGLHRYVNDKSFTPLIASTTRSVSTGTARHTIDFTVNREAGIRELKKILGTGLVCAHNASFEDAVLNSLGIHIAADRFRDSAVLARAVGASGHLEAAVPQLIPGADKMAVGKDLIKLFSIPGRYQEENDTPWFDSRVITDHPAEWDQFARYCEMDADLSLALVERFGFMMTDREWDYTAVTLEMCRLGWPVDMPAVEEMQRRYLENQEMAVFLFRLNNDAKDLNLNSLKQMKDWCAERGVRARSFDEKHVASLKSRLTKKIDSMPVDDPKVKGYLEVRNLLDTKQILGGSSLKKLKVITDTAVPDTWNPGAFRLRDQYLHCGAGQTLRTSGRSVQMQNLKRLATPADMAELDDLDSAWDNPKLAENIRQVFTASHKDGRLIVGDFKSVESRGLAYMAGEDWKLDAYRRGEDVYKSLASKIFFVDYAYIDVMQRKAGKLGELSCGYGAGGTAVQGFAENMGISMSEAEAAKLVFDWRQADPATVNFWADLDLMLHEVVNGKVTSSIMLPDGLRVGIKHILTPDSLLKIHPGARSVELVMYNLSGQVILRRVVHGCYVRGRNVCYYKPSSRKTGDLWRPRYMDPKTKQWRWYELYGGKLAGILTQSFCRELFFACLLDVHNWTRTTGDQVRVVGQFHDEIVLDWKPGALSLEATETELRSRMQDPHFATTFPLDAEVKSAYRYIK